jgi:hypothetical protein
MASSGISISPECISLTESMRVEKKIKWIVFKINNEGTEVVVEKSSENADWEQFREHLINAQHPNKKGVMGPGPRYAVYDFEWETASGEGTRGKLTFISWSPDDATPWPKMIYSSTKEALKRVLTGVSTDDLQVNDASDLEENEVLKAVSKGKAAPK